MFKLNVAICKAIRRTSPYLSYKTFFSSSSPAPSPTSSSIGVLANLGVLGDFGVLAYFGVLADQVILVF